MDICTEMPFCNLRFVYFIIFTFLLDCNLYSDEKVSILNLEVRTDGLFYKKDSVEPFSGTSIKYYENNSIGELETYKSGMCHGTHTGYHENGKISYKAVWDKGQLISSKTWSEKSNLIESVLFPNGPNDLNNTIKLMEELVVINQQKLTSGHIDLTQTLHKLASFYFEQGKVNLAIETSVRGVKNVIKGYGTQHKYYALALSHLASVQSDDKAISNIKTALNVISKTDDEDSKYTLRCELAKRYLSAGQIEEAISEYHSILSEIKANHLLSAEIYSRLEQCYLRKKDWEKAFFCTEKAIMLSKKLGKNEAQFVEIYLKSAVRFAKSGFLIGEFRQLLKALEIKEANNQFDDYVIAEINNKIGLNLLERGEYHRAGVLFVSAKKLWEKLKGKNSEEVATTWGNYSRCFIALDKHETALSLALIYRNRFVELYGENHPKTFRALCNLAEVYSYLGRHQTALACWIKASKCTTNKNFLKYNNDTEVFKVYTNIMKEYIKVRKDDSLPWSLDYFSQEIFKATEQYGRNHVST